MSLEIDYLPVATGTGANVDSQANFVGASYQTTGFQNGIAQPFQVNKILRQTSMVSAAVASFISNTSNIAVLDDGNLTNLITELTAAIQTSATTAGNGVFVLLNDASTQTVNSAITVSASPSNSAPLIVTSPTNILTSLFVENTSLLTTVGLSQVGTQSPVTTWPAGSGVLEAGAANTAAANLVIDAYGASSSIYIQINRQNVAQVQASKISSFVPMSITGGSANPLSLTNGGGGINHIQLYTSGTGTTIQGTLASLGGTTVGTWPAYSTILESVGGGPLILDSINGSNDAVYLQVNRNTIANVTSAGLAVTGTLSATTKNFSIPYPGNPSELLIHSSLEGPEIGVFYRGSAQLVNGSATITLPSYFEALTMTTGRTVLLTPTFTTAGEAISHLAASAVTNGQFSVVATDTLNPSQTFNWEVKATRSDQPALVCVVPSPTANTTTTT
jgi:hypothetical protein